MSELSEIPINDDLLRDSTKIINLAAQCILPGNAVSSFSIGKGKHSRHFFGSCDQEQERKELPAARLAWCIDVFVQALSYSKAPVRELFISYPHINAFIGREGYGEPEFAKRLSNMCSTFRTTLRSLHCARITDQIEDMIAENDMQLTRLSTTASIGLTIALPTNTTIQSLTLKNREGYWSSEKGVGKGLANYISASSELRFLTLRLDSDATKAACEGFKKNTSIVGLSLGLNEVQILFDSLHENPSSALQYLQITRQSDSHRSDGNFPVKYLPKDLKYLDLTELEIGDMGAISLVSLPEQFSNLTFLDLRDNNIHEQGGYAIANMLANNQCSLSHLDLQRNKMELACHSILSSLSSNTTLRFLDISECCSKPFVEGCVSPLIASLSKNRTLDVLHCFVPKKTIGNLAPYFINGTFSLKQLGSDFAPKHLQKLPEEARKFFKQIQEKNQHENIQTDEKQNVVLKLWQPIEDQFFAGPKNLQQEEHDIKRLQTVFDEHNIWEYLRTNDIENVKKSIEGDASLVGLVNEYEQTTLMLAALFAQIDTVDFLLFRKPDVNKKDKWGRTALHYAQNSAIAEKLIAYGARLDEADPVGWTPLCYAVAANDIERVKVLLKSSGFVDIEAISLALLLGHSDAANAILGSVNIPELPKDKFESMLFCCVIGKDDRLSAQIASQLLSAQAFQWPEKPKYDYLFASVAAKKVQLSKIFIENKAPFFYSEMGRHNKRKNRFRNVDKPDKHPRYHFHPKRLPQREGHYAFVKFYSPLRKACKNEDIAHIDLLLNNGFDVRKEDQIHSLVGEFNTKLKREEEKYMSKYHRTFGRYRLDTPKVPRSKEEIRHALLCVRHLVAKGANLWQPRSWMHKSIAVTDWEMFEFVDNYGTLPTGREVQKAAKEGNEEMLARFIEVYKLPVSSHDGFLNLTPLLLACKKGHMNCVKYLLDHGASLTETATTKVDGWLEAEAGHLAVGFNRPELLKFILSRGGPEYRIKRGLEIAVIGRYEECVKILLESGHTPESHHIECALTNDKAEDKKLTTRKEPLKKPQRRLPWNPKILALMLQGQSGSKEQIKALFEKAVLEDAKDVQTRSCARTESLISCFGYEVLSELKKLLYITCSIGNARMTELLLQHINADVVQDFVEEEKKEVKKPRAQSDFDEDYDYDYDDYGYGPPKKTAPPPLYHVSPLHFCNPEIYPIKTKNYIGQDQVISDHEGYAKCALLLLTHKHPANVNIMDDKKRTPLYNACAWGSVDVVQTLLEAGADVNLANEGGVTPLFAATCLGRLDVVKLLLLHKPEVDKAPTETGSFKKKSKDYYAKDPTYNPSDTPLHMACQSNDVEMVRALVNAGANVAAHSGYKNFTPLHYAASRTKTEILKILVDANKEILNLVNDDNQNAFATLMTDKDFGKHLYSNAQFFVTYSQSLDLTMEHALGLNAVHIFAMKHLPDLLAECLEKNPGLLNVRDKSGHTPLHYAALFSDYRAFKCAEILFEKGADVNAVCSANRTFAHFIAMKQDTSFLKMYNKERDTAWNTLQQAKTFYAKKYNITTAVNTMTTNCECSCKKMVRKLGSGKEPVPQSMRSWGTTEDQPEPTLETHFKGNIDEGLTPLACALFLVTQRLLEEDKNSERWAYVRLLLDCGADPNVHKGLSPLNIACQLCPVSMVKLLVEAGAVMEPNLLHVLFESHNLSVQKYMIAKYLLGKGIVINHEVNGKTPIKLAEELGLVDIVYLLLQNGAELSSNSKFSLTEDYFTTLYYAEKSHVRQANSHDRRNASMCIIDGNLFLSQFRGIEVFSTMSPQVVANINVDPEYGKHQTSLLFAWHKYLCHLVYGSPKIYLFNPETVVVVHTLEGHKDEPLCLCDVETNLCSGSKDGTIKMWDTNLKCISTLEVGEPILKMAYSAPYLFVRTEKTFNIQVWNIPTRQKIATLGNPTPEGHLPAISRSRVQGALVANSEMIFFVDEGAVQGYEIRTFMKKVTLPIIKKSAEDKYLGSRERVKENVILLVNKNKLFVMHNYTPDELQGQIYELSDLANEKIAPSCTFTCPGFQEASEALIHDGKLYVLGAECNFFILGCAGAGVPQHKNCSFRCIQSPPPPLQQQCRNFIAKNHTDYAEALKLIPNTAKGILVWEIPSRLNRK